MSDAAVDLGEGGIKITYHAGPVATAAHQSKATVKLAWGPLGTSKTTWLCWRALAICARAAKGGYTARIIFIRDTYRNLIDSTFQTWLEWFPKDTASGYINQSEPIEYKLNVGGRYHDIIFRHGQTEQDASMFLSTEYDGIMLEEVAPAYLPGQKKVSPGIAEGVFDMAFSRLTRKAERAAAIRPELCITCNSPPLTHWTSTRIIDKSPEYLRDLNWGQWFFPISDNSKNLRADYYLSLEKAWEGRRGLVQRFIKGQRLPVFVGIPRFNLDQLDRMRENAIVPPFRGFLKSSDENVLHVRLEANPEGYLRMWTPPSSDRVYVVGGDVAEGVEGGDFSSAHVLDRETGDIVATWHGHIEPELFGDELFALGALYCNASIGVESNNHGLTTLMRLRRLGYPNIYYNANLENRNRVQQKIGYATTVKSKPILIDGIAAYLKVEPGEVDPYLPDADTINELQTYGVMADGTTNAQEGCFDDRVISFGLAILMTKVVGLEQFFPSLGQQSRPDEQAAQS